MEISQVLAAMVLAALVLGANWHRLPWNFGRVRIKYPGGYYELPDYSRRRKALSVLFKKCAEAPQDKVAIYSIDVIGQLLSAGEVRPKVFARELQARDGSQFDHAAYHQACARVHRLCEGLFS